MQSIWPGVFNPICMLIYIYKNMKPKLYSWKKLNIDASIPS